MIQNILSILLRYGSTFLFVLLELICLYFIVNYNQEQKAIWANSSNIFTGAIYEKYDNFTSFFNLVEENNLLALENGRLLKELAAKRFKENRADSLISSNFEYIPALIINNSVNQLHNKITLNKGSKDGIEKGMGVITNQGVVGVVVYANEKFSSVNSILNLQTKVSGILKRTNALGDLTWKGRNPHFVSMNSVPQYVSVMEGDSVITSGYSTIFPKGQFIGQVSSVSENPKTGYYDIDVELHVNLASINHVFVIKNEIFDVVKDFENDSSRE